MTIVGAGGGGGKGARGGSSRTPSTAPDSLDSRQYANVIDLISEGEIEGLANGMKSIFLNNTPLQNPDGSYNFQAVEVFTRNGIQDQPYIPLTNGVEDELPVNVTVVNAVPQVKTITRTEVDAVRVTIAIPTLQQINSSNGDTAGTSVQLQIAVQYQGAGYTTVIDDTISGRTADEYRKQYLINLARPNPTDSVDIKVTRITVDSTDSLLANAFSWSSYTEIVYAKTSYPNSALVGLRIDAEQFNSIPTRSYMVKGIKIQIPSGTTVDPNTGRIIYPANFIWNGTFSAATWCSCPSFILWDLLTNTRYGFGDHIDVTQLDKWAFFAASKYANELVDDGYGGQEARFSCNTSIQTAEEAYKLVNDLLSVMRCQAFWSVGSLTIAQDAPADPVYLFNQSNVTPEGFSYSGSSLKIRPNVAVVGYLDARLNATTGLIEGIRDTAYEVAEDADSIAKYGVVRSEISAFACTSRGQANRIGRWLLFSERYEKEVCTFSSSLDAGQQVRPGQIISISDPVRAGSRRAGRIAAATSTTITVDDDTNTNLSIAGGANVSVILPNGNVEVRQVSSISGKVITVQSAFSSIPNVNSVWLLETTTLASSLWRVISISEQDGINYGITAIAHNPSKYAYIESGAPLEFRDITDLNKIPDAPTGLEVLTSAQPGGGSAIEVQYELNGRIAVKITFHWLAPIGIKKFRVKYRHEDDNFTTVVIQGTTFDILDVKPGNYQIQVSSMSNDILYSEPALANYTVIGLGGPPSNVTNLSAIAISEETVTLTWTQAPELDVRVGGRVIIRHDPRAIAAAEWNSSSDIVAAVAGTSTQKQVPLLPGTYFVKFEDYLGNRSVTAAAIEMTLPQPESRVVVKEWAEQSLTPPFKGTAINGAYSSGDNAYVSTPSPYVSNGYYEPIYCIGDCATEYQFFDTFDLGDIYDFRIRRRIVSRALPLGVLFDSVSTVFDSQPGLFDGTVSDDINVTMYVRVTQTDPAASPVWGPWTEFISGMIRGRGIQVKVIATTKSETTAIAIDELGATVELTRRVTTSLTTLTTPSTGSYVVTFPNAFYDTTPSSYLPSVGVTPLASTNNLTTNITGLSRTGFSVQFLQGATPQVVNFTYNAVGYGRAF
jgi:hypothetical protein